jgi:hypothetical protein
MAATARKTAGGARRRVIARDSPLTLNAYEI